MEEIIDLGDSDSNPEELRMTVLALLVDKSNPHARSEATEAVVQYLEKHHKFYTIRDDEKTEIWCYEDGIYIPNGQSKIKELCREILNESISSHFVNQVIFKIETDTYIEQHAFFNNNIIDTIATNNGLLHLKTRELTPYDPEKIFFTKIPICFDSNAQCPNIIQFFRDILKTEDDLPIIQELFGYLLWKEYNIERAFMFVGNGRNGKSKCMELMKRFIGADNCSSVKLQELEGDNFHRAELHKKLANLCGDLDDKALKYTGSFKEVTGRDLIKANRKFKTQINFENYAKMVFSANQLPRTSDLSEAFFMRWIILEFPYTFLKEEEMDETKNAFYKLRNPNIIQSITSEEEMSGLLNWAMEGLERLQDQKDFSFNQSSKQVKELWMRKSDSFQAFCMDYLDEEYGNEIEKGYIRHLYNNYCKRHKLKVVSDKSIKYTLSILFGADEVNRRTDDGRTFYWVGIKEKSQKDVGQKNLLDEVDEVEGCV